MALFQQEAERLHGATRGGRESRVSAMRNKTDAEFSRLMERIAQWQEAIVAAGAEWALLEARLSVVACVE